MPLDATPLPSEQPIRFYKFIALGFLCITLILVGTIIFMSSKRASITIITKSEPLEVTDTVVLDATAADALIPGFVTTTVITHEKVFSPEGTKTEDAAAEGTVTLINETDIPQGLIATTRVLSKEGVLFRLKDAVSVPAKGEIKASVYADVKGASGNIAATTFTIPGLQESKQKVIYAKSESAMSGGVRTFGVVGQDDIVKSEKVLLEEIKTKGADILKVEAPVGMTGLYQVVQSTFEPVEELGEEVDSFVIKGTATVVGVWYDPVKATAFAEDMLKKRVVDNSEILSSMEPTPSFSLESYDVAASTAKLTVSHRGLVNIDENSTELQKDNFFGKSEDEVKRYVMSLKHVEGVEMAFKPLWNRSVPRVASNVEVIIREVQ
ncbi:MAG TPA: hypothetical protein PK295_00160 [Candidatus Magasanikbacteria bacterium]|nr:hypothetical protein [Candidatus Magasanikbacteria bacterium]